MISLILCPPGCLPRLSPYAFCLLLNYFRQALSSRFGRASICSYWFKWAKVVMSGGAIVMPIFHEIIPINMNTLKLEVSRSTIDSLITKDRMRVDVVVAFFVRVKPSVEGIATAAQTLGQRTLSPEDLRMLVEDKFVDALRATAAQMTMHELQDTRENFVQGVQNTVAEDLSKNGLELESVSLTNFNQTSKEHFNPNNAFDAEGLTKLTQETERRRRERNEVEQDVKSQCVRKTVMHFRASWRLNNKKRL